MKSRGRRRTKDRDVDEVTVQISSDAERRHRTSSANQPLSIEVEGNLPKKVPAPDNRKLVKIGLNLIGLSEIDDINETYVANFLFHIDHPADITPWQMWKTAVEMNTLENPGIPKDGFNTGPNRKRETTNYVGKFSNPLQLQNFPFDVQKLRLTLVLNDTKTIKLVPLSANAIKANLEFDTLAEWDILRTKAECNFWEARVDDKELNIVRCNRCEGEIEFHEACKKFKSGKIKDSCQKCGFPADDHEFWKRREKIRPHAVSIREIIKASPSLSASNLSYYNLNFSVVVQRKFKPILYNVVFPTFILALSSFTIYAVEPIETVGDRLAILFTVVLSLVTNQVRTRDRLPNIEYLTVIDKFMWAMQGFVYLVAIGVVAVAALCDPQDEVCAREADYYVMLGNVGAFVLCNFYFSMIAFVQLRERRQKVTEIRNKYNAEFKKNELELRRNSAAKRPKMVKGDSVSQLRQRAIASEDSD